MAETPPGEENQPSVEPGAERPLDPTSPDFVSDIRRDLTQTEKTAPEQPTGLLGRVTGLFRRKKTEPAQPAPQAEPPPTPSTGTILPGVEPGLLSLEFEEPETVVLQPAEDTTGMEDDDIYSRLLAGSQEPDSQSSFSSEETSLPDLIADEEPAPESDNNAGWMPQASQLIPTDLEDNLAGSADDGELLMPIWEERREEPPAVDELAAMRSLFELEDEEQAPPAAPLETMLPESEEPAASSLFAEDELRSNLFDEELVAQALEENTPPLFDDDLMQPDAGLPVEPKPAEPEPTPVQPPKTKGLRSLFIGILRPSEAKKKDKDAGEHIDDNVVTSRLSRSLGMNDDDAGQSTLLEASHEPMDLGPGGVSLDDDDTPDLDRIIMAAGPLILPGRRPFEARPPAQEPDGQQATAAESAAPDPANEEFSTDRLKLTEAEQKRLDQLLFDGIQPDELLRRLNTRGDETAEETPYEDSVPVYNPFADDDFLVEPEPTETAVLSDGEETIEGRLGSVEAPLDENDRSFWEGTGVRQTKASAGVPVASMEEMRSTLLEDYSDRRSNQIEVNYTIDTPAIPEAKEPRARSLSKGERTMLLVLGVLVITLAVVVTLVFFKPAPQVVATPVVIRPTGEVISGASLPTGIELPGGWYFPIERNTLVDGKWQPRAAEWWEGSERPRLIAIPWNRQTEAVIQTFSPGDEVVLSFDNGSVAYKVFEVKRVETGDTTIITDTSNALVVVLYQEDADMRWVITAK